MKKRDENSQLEMLEGAKSMGAGAATIGFDFIMKKKDIKKGYRIDKIQRQKERISCHPVKMLFSKLVAAFVAILFSSFLGSEGIAIMTRGINIFFFGILIFCFGLLFRIFYIKQKKGWLFQLFLFIIIYIYVYFLRIFLVAHLGTFVNWGLPFVVLGVSGKEILVHSETSSASTSGWRSFEERVLLEPMPSSGESSEASVNQQPGIHEPELETEERAQAAQEKVLARAERLEQEFPERSALFLEVKALIVQQLQEASRKAHEVRLSVLFPEMQEADFDTAEWIMDWDLELSRETTDAATLREWRDSIRENPRLLRDIISEYVIVVTNPKKYDLSEIYGLCRKDTKLD